jgi:bacteriorhodopsin
MIIAEHRSTTKWGNYAVTSSGLLFVLMGSAQHQHSYSASTENISARPTFRGREDPLNENSAIGTVII